MMFCDEFEILVQLMLIALLMPVTVSTASVESSATANSPAPAVQSSAPTSAGSICKIQLTDISRLPARPLSATKKNHRLKPQSLQVRHANSH